MIEITVSMPVVLLFCLTISGICALKWYAPKATIERGPDGKFKRSDKR